MCISILCLSNLKCKEDVNFIINNFLYICIDPNNTNKIIESSKMKNNVLNTMLTTNQ